MRFITAIIICLFSSVSIAQELSHEVLDQIRTEVIKTDNFQTKQNILTHSSIKTVTTSRINEDGFDREFTHIINRGPVTNQKKSGRCWIFAGLNVVRYEVAQHLNMSNFEFSENYLFFFHKLELSNYLLEQAISGKLSPSDYEIAWALRHGLSDGGYWDMFVYLYEKYGSVPRSIMPESVHSSNSRELNELLDKLVKKHVAKIWNLRANRSSKAQLREQKLAGIKEVYQLLALLLGTPPENFEWRYRDKDENLTKYKSYTPLSFVKQFTKEAIISKIHLMSDPSLPYYKQYILKGVKNVIEKDEKPFLNVPVNIIISSAKEAVLSNYPIWFGADVGKYADFQAGILDTNQFNYEQLIGFPIELPKASRLRVYASAPTHAMVIMGVDLDSSSNPVKWLVENSWGADSGDGGYLIMTNDWLREYVFDIIVDKMFVSTSVLEALNTPIIELPIWHHLWTN